MDLVRIAALLRETAVGTSRRTALAALVASLSAISGGTPTSAARRCRADRDCPSRSCNARSRRCRCSDRGKGCRNAADCCSGLQCSRGVCEQARAACGPATCRNGCCRNGACLPGNATDACGSGGAACDACTSSRAPVCRNGTCAAGSWTRVGEFGTGVEGSGNDQFKRTRGVVLSPDGLMAWVADGMNYRISIWSRPNARSTAWAPLARFGASGSGPAEFSSPASLALSPDALTLWVCDRGNSRISVWTRPSATSTAWTPATTFGAGRLSNPTDVVVSPDTLTAFVADTGKHRIYVWTRPNATSTDWTYHSDFGLDGDAAAFWIPYGIFVSPDSRTAWITSWFFAGVSTWTRPDPSSSTWTPVLSMGSNAPEGGDLDRPSDVIISADSLTMWVLSQWGRQVTIWTRPDPDSLEWTIVDASADGRYIPLFGLSDAFTLSGDERTMLVTETIANRVAVFSLT